MPIVHSQVEELPEKEDVLKKIVDQLNVGVDLPFFFNGDTNKIQWECKQIESLDEEKRDLLKPFQYEGTHFKAYDESYDVSIEFEISSDSNSVKVFSFPIIAYAYTEEGYQKIYQGINVIPLFKFEKSFEFHLKIKTF